VSDLRVKIADELGQVGEAMDELNEVLYGPEE